MKLNREELRGTRSVFNFTLKQYAKSKANMITLIISLVAALISVPVMSLIMGNKADELYTTEISKVYIENATDYALSAEDLSSKEGWSATEFETPSFTYEESHERLSAKDVYIAVSFDEVKHSYTIKSYTSDDTEISEDELSGVEGFIAKEFNEARYKDTGATEEQISVVMSNYNVESMSMYKYISKYNGLDATEQQNSVDMSNHNAESTSTDKHMSNDEGPGMDTLYIIQYAYDMVVFMLCLFSTMYIIRAIIEEKDSKLVELLMVSVKPLALIAGKILAVMAYIFATLLMLLAALGVSYFAGGLLTGTEHVKKLAEGIGLTASSINISPMTIVIILVSLALGYLALSIIAGIAGTCCSSMEDVQSASTLVTMVAMFGYFVSIFATTFSSGTGSSAVAIIVSLVPIASIFCAPVQYIFGNISIYILLLSWVIQIGTIILLSVFCSKVYAGLIIHKGSRVKLKQLLSMAGLRKVKEV